MTDQRWRVSADEAGERLDRFLGRPGRLGSRGRAVAALERGKVFLNGAETVAEDRGRQLEAGDDVRLWMDRPGSARMRARAVRVGALRILYDDATVVVVDKPPGVLTVPLARSRTASVQELLATEGRSARLLAVHRIDRDTSGVVAFAKTPAAQAALRDQFTRREPEREYLALVHGSLSTPSGTWRDRLVWDPDALVQRIARGRGARAMDAVTHYMLVEQFGDASLVRLRLETGRRNQIRVQAAAHGHPLVGERQYASSRPIAGITFERQALHAERLAFRHPVDGRRMTFVAPLPPDMMRLLARLRAR